MPTIDVYREQQLQMRLRLGAAAITVGRDADCDVQLPDALISRRHAVLTADDDGVYRLEDRSTNGTRLNADMVEVPMALSAGDRIYLGRYVLVFEPSTSRVRPFLEAETYQPMLGAAGR